MQALDSDWNFHVIKIIICLDEINQKMGVYWQISVTTVLKGRENIYFPIFVHHQAHGHTPYCGFLPSDTMTHLESKQKVMWKCSHQTHK